MGRKLWRDTLLCTYYSKTFGCSSKYHENFTPVRWILFNTLCRIDNRCICYSKCTDPAPISPINYSAIPPLTRKYACREFFIDSDRKMQYLLNRSFNFRYVYIWSLEKMCLTKRDSWRLYLMNFFFQVCNCNITILRVASTATLQLQLG